MSEKFLNGRIELHCGDCLNVLAALPENSIDSACCDPPYHLTSIVDRFGGDNAAPAKSNGATGVYARASSGFMGKKWDGGDVAFRAETWEQILRVLKPGAHLLAFGGTRTYHRMACAIEDAGFEIRDSIQWLYGSGFPKSLDVSKAIDKRGGAEIGWFGPWLREERGRRGISSNDLAKHFPSKTGGETGCVRNWELGLNLPTAEQFNTLCQIMDLPFAKIEEAERVVVGKNGWTNSAAHFVPGEDHTQRVKLDVTTAATDAARQWSGYGTALKPACEPIVLARKPLSESTVAGNVLRWGTGALNIDGCRVGTDGGCAGAGAVVFGDGLNGTFAKPVPGMGRWPANVIHDGSDEVVGAFPYSKVGASCVKRTSGSDGNGNQGGAYGAESRPAGTEMTCYGDEGSAARFFYTAKADADDRLGSKHPTVKPLDLMQYLVRLVTPPRVVDYVCETCNNPPHDSTQKTSANSSLCDLSDAVQAEGQRARGEILQPGVCVAESASSPTALRTVRGNIPAEEGRAEAILLADVRDEMVGAEEEKAAHSDGSRLSGVLPTGPSDGDQDGLRDGPSFDNGGASRKESKSDRSGASHQRRQRRQPNREFAGDVKGGSRQDKEAAPPHDHSLPPLQGAHQTERWCPNCNSPLTRVERRGVVLDPFAGTGTAGEAAWRMGFKAILIERETEYCNDIRRRMALCLAGPDERQRESIKARLQGKPVDDGPLFGGTE